MTSSGPAGSLGSLVAVLTERSARHGSRDAFLFLDDAGEASESIDYAGLDRRARAVATALVRRGAGVGDPVLLLYPPGLDLIAAFWGCLYAGAVAVPAYPPRPGGADARLAAVAGDCRPRLVATTSRLEGRVASLLAGIERIATDTLPDEGELAASWRPPAVGRDHVAFLQYTSGSTSAPKGVVVRHGNLLHNQEAIRRAFGTTEASVVAGWLPLYHDMGLIGTVLHPLYLGARCVLTSPLAFLRRPRLWLEMIGRHGATVSGGPNFAYDLCVRRVPESQRAGLDLSSWRVAFNGAEPVRASTLEEFAAAFAPCGFDRRAFFPCYGLAESTLFVTGAEREAPPTVAAFDPAALEAGRAEPAPEGRELVSSGRPVDARVEIVDPGTGARRAPGGIGEIWVASGSVAAGYRGGGEASAETFGATLDGDGPFLRTGDLGFLRDGELFVTGRLKDLIILRGRNLYPQDVEASAEASHPALRPAGAAAFAVDVAGEERLVVAAELERRREGEAPEAVAALRRAVADQHQAAVHEVVLLRAGTLPRTTSGKVRRAACRAFYRGDEPGDDRLFLVVARDRLPAAAAEPATAVADRETLLALDPTARAAALEGAVAALAAEVLAVDAEALDPETPLTAAGLDSLRAIELADRLEARLDLRVPLAHLLAGASAADLARSAEGAPGAPAGGELLPLRTAGAGDVLPLSWEQRSLWFLEGLAAGSGVTHVAVAAETGPGLDPEALRRALAEVVARHPALRTVIETTDEGPRQRVLPAAPEPPLDFALETVEACAGAGGAPARLSAEAFRPFDLERGPLVRVRLWPRPGGGHLLLLAVHHLAVDLASFEIVLRDLEGAYRRATGDGAASLPPPPEATYGDYARRQDALLRGPAGARLEAAWRQLLEGRTEPLELPADRPRPALQTYRGGRARLTLEPPLVERLRVLAGGSGTTLFQLLLAAFHALLRRLSGQAGVAVATPISGRGAGRFRDVVGDFANLVLVAPDAGTDPRFLDLLAATARAATAAVEHRAYPFALLAETLAPARDPSRPPLAQAMFRWQQARSPRERAFALFGLGVEGAEVELAGRRLAAVAIADRPVQLDLELSAAEGPDGEVVALLDFNRDLFDATTAGRWLALFRTLLAAAVEHPERRVSELDLLPPAERARLREWNDTGNPDPAASVEARIARHLGRSPDRIAVGRGARVLTRGELHRRALRFAAELRRQGAGPEVRVAVCLERDPDLVTVVLAVLYAGAAWVPLDPDHPPARLADVLAGSGASLLVGPRRLLDRLFGAEPSPAAGVRRLALEALAAAPPAEGLPLGAPPRHLAYTIYTSGSTGRPKGVEVSRAALAAFLDAVEAALAPGEDDLLAAVTTLGFDISILELLLPLATGGRVEVVPREEAADGAPLGALLDRARATLLQATPATWRLLLDAGWQGREGLTALCGGEALDRELAAALAARTAAVVNLYGPTECTVWATARRVDGEEAVPPGGVVPLGRPLAGTRAHVLDRHLRAVPSGVVGELHLGGAGVARGYRARPGQTAELFVPDPGSSAPGGRLYRTGDLARHLASGEIEFLGRTDHQVKVRGFRIELGEIEAVLGAHPGVHQAVVVADGPREGARLVAWVVPEATSPEPGAARPEEPEEPAADWRRYLEERLPAYMVPSLFLPRDRLPLGPSGKVDRRALAADAAAEGGRRRSERPWIEPAGPLEATIAGVFGEVLGVDRVGAADDFFALGGHSLVAARCVARLRAAVGVDLPLSALFVRPTPAALAAWLEREGGARGAQPESSVAGSAPPGEPAPLSFAQERLWFLERLSPGSAAYHLPGRGRLRGPLSPAALATAVAGLVRRHEALATRIVETAGGGGPESARQAVLPSDATGSPLLPRIDLAGIPAPLRRRESRRLALDQARRPFRLAGGPLVRFALVARAPEDHELHLCLHHLVADGRSLEVLLGDLADLYAAALAGRRPTPPAPGPTPRDFAAWQRHRLTEGAFEPQLAWWREYLDGVPAALDLPADRPRPPARSFAGARATLALPEATAAAAGRLAEERGATLFMVLLAAFQVLLHRLSDAEDFVIGTPAANRRRGELDRMVGLLANLLAVRARLAGEPRFDQVLAAARRAVLDTHERQEAPFEKLVEELRPERDPARPPLVQVAFAAHPGWPRRPFGAAELELEELPTGSSKFDLTLTIEGTARGLVAHLEHSTELFDRATARRWLGAYGELLRDATARPGARLSELSLLSAAERRQLLAEGIGAAAAPYGGGVHHLVAEAARRWPEAAAVVAGERRLSYRELAGRSGALARRLHALGVGPEAVVALDLERSPELAVAALGVLSAGGAYLPLDPGLPAERLAWILADSGARVLVRSGAAPRPPEGVAVVDLEGLDPETPESLRAQSFDPPSAEPRQTAYVIYTSGSTGEPKGVAVPHRGLENLVRWHLAAYGLAPGERSSLVASPGFDASVWELWPCLASGGALHVPDAETRADPDRLTAWLAAAGVHVAFLPTPLARAVLAALPPGDAAGGELRALLTGGDRLPAAPAVPPPFRLVNHYGPTESSVVTTAGEVTPGGAGAPAIGRPIAGLAAHLADRRLRLAPPHAPGELVIAGAGLARGYRRRPAATAAAFVPDPFGTQPGGRLYRSGDLARRRPDGALDFLGRIDQQVQVRGQRVETGEVEAALGRLPGVAEAAVVARTGAGGETTLAAFVVPAPGAQPAAGEILAGLVRWLPAYMVPASVEILDELPLTARGKVDRAALRARPVAAEPERAAGPGGLPRTPVEELVVALVAELLERERVAVDDDFFALGGHSLLAGRLAARVRETFGVELELAAVFEGPTPAALAQRVEAALHGAREPEPGPLPATARARPDRPPLSFAQERLWFLDRLESVGAAYHVAGGVRLRGELDADRLESALAALVARHEALRTRFPASDGVPWQEVGPVPAEILTRVDLRGVVDPTGALARLAQRRARHPFDLERGPLHRFTLVRLGEDEHVLLVAFHHAVADGGSLPILWRDLAALYGGEELPPLALQYADYALWQRRRLDRERDRELAWWREHLAGLPPVLELPSDRPRPPRPSGTGGVVRRTLPAELVASADGLARRSGASRFMVLLAVFQALLGRSGGQEDFAVGTPMADRGRRELEDLVGLFLDTLVLRADLAGDPPFRELLRRVRATALGAYAHRDLPFERLVEALAPARSRSHEPLVQVLLVLEAGERVPDRLGDLAASAYDTPTGAARLDLTLSLAPRSDGGLDIHLEYAADLFDATTAARLTARFAHLLGAAARSPEARLSELPAMPAAERFQVLREWNDSRRRLAGSAGGATTLGELFARQAERSPETVAVVEDGSGAPRHLTFGALARRTAALGAHLASLGAGPEVAVGLCAERSLELAVGLLAIVEAGAAWLPLDPTYPRERLEWMLEDAGAPVVVAQGERRDLLAGYAGEVVPLEPWSRSSPPAPPGPAPRPSLPPEAAAYLIYTSGSTGRPKGVVNGHRGIVNRLLWFQQVEPLGPDDRVLQKTPIGFDVSVWELCWPLVTGARLVLARPGGHRDGAYLAAAIARHRVTTAHFVPSMLAPFLEEPGLESDCRTLRRVVASGEALAPELVARYARRLTAPLYDLYGPTEAAVEVSWARVASGGEPARPDVVPIGRPISNLRLVVADRALRPAPLGVAGELVIGGAGVARGYLRRPGATAERFVPDPHAPEPGARAYRTGDRARTLASGEIDFLGRLDHQVKVRGQRIEPGEIEALLAAHADVRAAAVVAVPDGAAGLRLAAFVVPAGDGADPAALGEALRGVLARELPPAMVPSAVLAVPELPLTPSGKLDRVALAALAREAPDAAPAGVARRAAPRGPVEELLAGIWSELLGISDPAVDDDFFALGGHSLLATRVMSRVRRALDVELPLEALFEAPTVAGLARAVERALSAGGGDLRPPLERAPERAAEPEPSFAQERLWFLDRLEPGTAHYNLPTALRLRGPLDGAALARALTRIAARHETLRTSFVERDGRPRLRIARPRPVVPPRVDLSGLAGRPNRPERAERELNRVLGEAAERPFDLDRGPLWRTLLLRLGPREHVLAATLHHAVADGWSLGLLVRELASDLGGDAPPPPELPVAYSDYARWQRSWLRGEGLERHLAWWRRALDGVPALEIPGDRPRGPIARATGATWPVALSAALVRDLEDLARAHGGTLFMALLAGFGVVLGRHAGREVLPVGTAAAHRDDPAVEDLIGLFVNTLALRVDLGGEPTVGELLERVRATTLGAFRHQDLPFERLVEELRPERDLRVAPLVQVMLVLQNAPAPPLELPGLTLEPLEVESPSAKLDLTLSLGRRPDGGLAGTLRYRSDLLDATSAGRMARHLETVLRGMAGAGEGRADRRLSDLPLQPPAERHQVLLEWSVDAAAGGRRGAPPTLPELFARWVERTPDAPAVVAEGSGGDLVLTYRELAGRAAALATRLAALGVGPGDRVGLIADPSPFTIAAILACFERGAAYVPVDPATPPARRAEILDDAGVAAVLGPEEPERAPLPSLLRPAARPAPAASLAYVIYTSGSTGRPKGVAVEHRHLAAYLDGLAARLDDGPAPASWATVSSPATDLGNTAIFGALGSGACLHLPGRERTDDAEALGAWLERHPVEALKIVPSHLAALLAGERPERLLPRRWLVVGGEACGSTLVEAVRVLRPGCRVLVHYGPTETTVGVAGWPVPPRVPPAAALPLGRPFRGTRAVVADAAGRTVPPGAPGELLLAGAQVARGYLGRPAATAAVFVPDPYPDPGQGAAAGARLYRSGDLARQRADGLLEFLGRIDHQVKVRGHRVETGEVEAALLAVPGVAEAAVVPWGEGTATRLAAYVAPARGSEVPDSEALRRSLLARLPEAMVPAAFVVLDLLPRLANGKVDRASLRRAAAGNHPDLPAPRLREGGEGSDAAGAGRALTPTEEIVAGFWSELLGVARPAPGADFFALGGHSLLATRLASRLRRTFGVDLPLRALFEAPTLAGLAARLDAARVGGAAGPEPPLPPAPGPASDRGDAPLSFAQERLWLLDRLAPGDPAYAVPYALAVRGRLDAAALAAALGTLVRRHPGLRTTFPLVDGAPVQRVHPPAAVALPTVDLAALPAGHRAAVAAREVAGFVRRPFDLARGPLMRALLVRLGENEDRVVVNLHHVVSDAWSRGILARELGRLYSARVAGRPAPELPVPAVSYADYARWQRRHLAGERLDALLASWRHALAGLPPLELPTDRPRREAARRPAARVTATLPAPLAAAAGELARREGATLFMVLLAAFDLVLARHAGQDDLAVGTSVANRERPEVEGVIGFFVNTLVLRARLGELAPGAGFRDLLAQARRTTLEAYAHQALPFERLVAELRPGGRRGAAPLVQAMLVLQNAPGGLPELAGAEVTPLAVDTGSAKFELTVVAEPRDDGALGLTVELDRGLYDATTGARLASHLRNLLAAAVATPEAPLPALEMLSPAERHQALAEWSGRGVTPPELDLPIPRIFARRAAEAPDAVAVSSRDGELTYAELSRRAARLARSLRALSVGAETRIGLCAGRSPEMVVATLAVLQAGAAYVPLDPRYPRERLAFMLADAGVSVVLADAERLGLFEGLEGVRTRLLTSDGAEGDADAPPPAAWTPDRLAYVMYTSGSTGRPKGVAVPHRAVVRLVRPGGGPGYARFAADETFLQYAPISFDAATLEIWAPLLNGGRLVLAPPGRLSLAELGRAVERGRVTSAWLTAGLFHRAVEDALGSLGGLTRLLAGGDVLSPPHVRRALAALPGLTLVNGYGPTENTTFTCCHVLRGADEVGATVPVGRPIAGTRTHLVDPALRPAPPGAAGELVAAGAGLARGYLGRPARTAELFVPDPFADGPGGRLYRTGDLARHRRDGAVEFLGRRDRQVKVRGFRIEPGEIEALLVARPEVREAVVVPRETPAGRILVAYLVPHLEPHLESGPGPRAGDDELRRALAERLPEHALPAAFVRLDALPLDPNGKVDRAALPEPGRNAEAVAAEAPEGPVEELLSVLWTETLGRPAGRNEDFFDAGGNSLQATRLVARIRRAFGVELPLERVFDRPTVAGLAGEVAAALSTAGPAGATAAAPPLERRPGGGPAPLSFAQERLWFLEQLEPGDPAYHVPAAIRLAGSLDVRALSGALAAVVARQAALRTRFVVRAGTPVQEVDPPRPGRAVLPLADLEALPAPRRAAATAGLLRAAARRGFDLSAAPPVRFLLVRDTERAHVLSIVMHHAVSDGWSIGVLLRELMALYAVLAAGARTRDAELPELPVEYPDFAVWQRRWLAGAELERQLDYWRRHLAEAPPLHLPYDRPAGAAAGRRGERREVRLGRELTEAIESACRRASVTPYMLLLAAFDLLLARYAGQDDLVVGTPVANRTRVETEGLVGCFVNTLALRARLDPDEGFDAFLARVRADVLAAHAHQDLPFEKLVEELPVARDLAATPLFQTLFVLQNLPWPRLELPGLAAAAEGVETGAAKFDLTLALTGGPTGSQGGLHGTLEYAADRFDATTAARLARAYRTLLEAVASDPSRRLRELPLLAAAERAQVLVQWSEDGAAATGSAITLPALFEARAAEAPEAVAVVAGGERLSYRELGSRANRLAHLLRARGAGPETPVGVLLERNADLVVALLAVLKAGGAYVPLDPAYPPRRLELLLADSGAPVVLTSTALAPLLGSLAGGGAPSVAWALDELAPELAAQPDDPPAPPPVPGQLAYVIYTSGSTGRPKGVALEHAAAAALARWAEGAYSRCELDGVLASTSVSFDLSVFEILTTLALGGRVILADHALALAELPARHEVTLLNTVPSAMAELLRLDAVPASVQTVNLAGEPLRRTLVDEIGRRIGQGGAPRVLNLYGPSEDTTYSTWAPAEPGAREEPTIGRPLPGTSMRLLGPGLEPVPLGAVGTIHLGGAGLARGYRGRPGLTADRFTPDAWSAAPGRRLYRTGDLARFTPDGRLVFLGRADHQVKVRGFRIELGEVEAALAALPGVEDAAVAVVRVDGEEGTDRLAAWVVPAADGAPGSDRLRELLRARLPAHMVPGTFRFLPALPRTPNGKLDRRALPAADAAPEERPFQPPRDALEEVLASLWAEALGVERVGVDDDFFDLGGHSLLATRLAFRLRETLRLEIPLRELFAAPTVAGLAAALRREPARRAHVDRVAELVLRVARMSEQEADRMMATEPARSA